MGDPQWESIFAEPFVGLIIGARGSGKTALGHRLLEVYARGGRGAYILGFPEQKAEELPPWIEPLPVDVAMHKWPEDSVVLIHEAHMVAHARDSMDSDNINLDELVTTSRHRDSCIIYETQQTQRLDRNAVAATDAVMIRWPALLQEQFERKQLRSIVSMARDELEKWVDRDDSDDYTLVQPTDELQKHVYVYSEWFQGLYPHQVKLPDHWSDDISKAYGALPQPDTPDDDPDDPFSVWIKHACPHVEPTKRSDEFRAGHYLCSDCATQFDVEPTTPYSQVAD